jgi:UTP--glucose-1-phosphate uridylyltransferase
MNSQRSFPSVPLVKLGTSFIKVIIYYFSPSLFYLFYKVKDFLSRFQSIPDCLELDSLTVSGDVHFGKGVSLRVSREFETKKIVYRFLILGYGYYNCQSW